MMDALTYRPDAVGDWKRVIGLLGGGWGVRGPLLAVGGAGILATFFWIPRVAIPFLGTGPGRARPGLSLLLAPFLAVSSLLTVLALGHPLGTSGLILTSLKHWMGYSALAWAPFIAGSMVKDAPAGPPTHVVPILPPSPGSPCWCWRRSCR